VTTVTAPRAASRAPRAHDIDVRLVDLDQPVAVVERLGRFLSEDEHARASRFVFGRDAARFTVGRAALRSILGRALGARPEALRFTCGARGKPELAAPFDGAGLTFNVAHSSTLALVAVTREARIGVDVERWRQLENLSALAEHSFSPRERHALLTLPAEQHEPAFFRCWTRKEAFVKATGDGLSYPLKSFSVSLRPEDAPRLEEIDGDESAGLGWTVWDFEPARGYAAAVVVDGRCARFSWSPWEHCAS
jgi:4'-phosphopantetheinyl transferase